MPNPRSLRALSYPECVAVLRAAKRTAWRVAALLALTLLLGCEGQLRMRYESTGAAQVSKPACVRDAFQRERWREVYLVALGGCHAWMSDAGVCNKHARAAADIAEPCR